MYKPFIYHPNIHTVLGKLLPVETTADELWDELDWVKREDAPRFECWMNDINRPYTYGRGNGERTYDARPYSISTEIIRTALNIVFCDDFNCCFVNGYPDETYHLGWHSDNSPEMDNNHPIAVVSFGAEREIYTREIGSKGADAITKTLLNDGSLFYMKEGMQLTHEHKIPKHSGKCDKRVSLTFRKIL